MFGIAPKNILMIVLALLAALVIHDWSMRDITHPPGVLVPERPLQIEISDGQVLTMDEYQLRPRARFQIRARVLSREDYNWGTEADLSPMDLALGWGVMSDQAVLDRIDIQQRSRWYFTSYDYPAPVPDQEIIRNSGNMHMIPGRPWLESELKKIRRGDIVQLNGYLVDVDSDSGWRWRTSLSRDDSGNGACEILYLESVVIEEPG
jgi:hypothetical protein